MLIFQIQKKNDYDKMLEYMQNQLHLNVYPGLACRYN